jgi:hypothetical protein
MGLYMLLLALALLLLRPQHPLALQNLLANPNFELVDASGGWPRNWSRGGSIFQRSTAQHVPGATASLEYRNYDPAAYEMVVQHVDPSRVVGGHRYTLSADIMAAHLNASAYGGGATICAQWSAPPFYGDYLGSGPSGVTNWTRQALTFVYPPSAPAMSVAAYVRPLVQGTNRTPIGVAYFGNLSLIHTPPPTMRTELVSPIYRGRITATAPTSISLRAHLHFELDPGQTSVVTLVATLSRRVGGPAPVGAAVATRQVGPIVLGGAGRGSVEERAVAIVFDELAPASLQQGPYIVSVSCHDAQNRSIGGPTQLHNLTRLDDAAAPAAVELDQRQRTLVDGQPFFPIGWFFGAGEEMTPGGADFWRFELLSKSSFNSVMPYGESSRVNLDAAAALGMKVVSSLKQVYFGMSAAHGPAPAAITSIAAEAPYLRERILATRNHSALLAWYTNDELDQSFLPQISTHYELFVELDPDHPTWQVLCEVGHFDDYLGTFDVLGSDPYPIGRVGRGAWGVEDEMNDTVTETDAARPVWEVLQAINWKLYNPALCVPSGNSTSLCHTPNATEVRSMTWQAINAGANGIFYW